MYCKKQCKQLYSMECTAHGYAIFCIQWSGYYIQAGIFILIFKMFFLGYARKHMLTNKYICNLVIGKYIVCNKYQGIKNDLAIIHKKTLYHITHVLCALYFY